MKIVLTNNALGSYYGTETWTYAMSKELSKYHDVEVYTKHQGKMAGKMAEKVVCPVYTEMRDADLYIVNHSTCYSDVPDDKPIIFTSHGTFGIEEPPDCFHVGVTEETSKGAPVIRNGIDCERFCQKKPVNEVLTNVLYLSHPDYRKGKEIVLQACEGLNVKTIDEEVFEIEDLINWADVVVTLGRGILESLACGRNVVSADWRADWMDSMKGAGMLTEDNFDELKTHAFSGRQNPIIFNAQNLRKEIDKFDPKRNLRHRILKEFNIKKTCQQYLTYFKKGILLTKKGKKIQLNKEKLKKLFNTHKKK